MLPLINCTNFTSVRGNERGGGVGPEIRCYVFLNVLHAVSFAFLFVRLHCHGPHSVSFTIVFSAVMITIVITDILKKES